MAFVQYLYNSQYIEYTFTLHSQLHSTVGLILKNDTAPHSRNLRQPSSRGQGERDVMVRLTTLLAEMKYGTLVSIIRPRSTDQQGRWTHLYNHWQLSPFTNTILES